MKIGTVAGTNGSTTTIATNDMVQEHVTNFTKETVWVYCKWYR